MWPVRVLQQKVSSVYYSYGLYCATHQLCMIAVSFLTFCFVCYPLTQIPFLGSVPSRYVTRAGDCTVPTSEQLQHRAAADTGASDALMGGSSARVGSVSSSGPDGAGSPGSDPPPAWWNGHPAGYVQQILLKATVAPWRSRTLHALDAFRGPLRVAFDVVDHIGYVRHETSDAGPRTFDEACLRVAEPRAVPGRRQRASDAAGRSDEEGLAAAVPASGGSAAAGSVPLLPEYGCLVLSPTGLWGGSSQRFATDRDPLRTIYASIDGRYEMLASSPPLRELLFGVPLSESGVSKYYLRSRQRIIYYAVTLVMSNYSAGLVAALRSRLLEKYPLSVLNYRIAPNGLSNRSNASSSSQRSPGSAHSENVGCDDILTHVTYGQSERAVLSYVFENLPLIVAYVVLFLYIYFSVQKIEMVKSKWGLALSAVATVVASLLMSFSICVSFGMRPSVSGTDMFPYLVVIVGLENMMVLTRAVASTPLHLEVPLRVAQGLGREGWNISKYLLTELVVLAAGFFMLVPAVQEFCLFAIVGLFVDFFLQMTFFATVLSIDIRRLELEDLNRHRVYGHRLEAAAAASAAAKSSASGSGSAGCGSHAFVLGGVLQHQQAQLGPGSGHLFGSGGSSSSSSGEYSLFALPRRVRFMNFVAQKRFMQSLIIVTVLLWIAAFVYNAGSIGKFLQSSDSREQEAAAATLRAVAEAAEDPSLPEAVRKALAAGSPLLPSVGRVLHAGRGGQPDLAGRAKYDNWERLAFMHWPAIFNLYNIRVAGTYLTFLPSIKLSVIVNPDEALALRRVGGSAGTMADNGSDDDYGDAVGRGEDADEEDDASARVDDLLTAVVPGDRSRDDYSDARDEAMTADSVAMPQLSLLLNSTLGIDFGTKAFAGWSALLALVAACLVFSSGCVILYRCMCSRNYHEWRPLWFRGSRLRRRSLSRGSSVLARWRRHLGEGTALSLDGHRLPIECVAVDGGLAATSCLGGEIRVWDPAAGQLVVAILRHASSSAPMSACSAAVASTSETSRSWSPVIRATPANAEATTPKSFPSITDRRSRLSSVSSAGELSPFIETDFASMTPKSFASCLDEMQQALAANLAATPPTPSNSRQGCDMSNWIGANRLRSVTPVAGTPEPAAAGIEGCFARLPSYAASLGRIASTESLPELCHAVSSSLDLRQPKCEAWPAIWCLTLHDGLVAAGCSDGSVELWDAVSGELRGVFRLPDGGCGTSGVTAVKLENSRLLVGRADGTLDFAEISMGVAEPRSQSATSSVLPPSTVFRSSLQTSSSIWGQDGVRCVHLRSVKAHQGAVHFLEVGAGRAVTAGGGGQDASVLKIFSLDDACLLHALRGQAGRASDLPTTSQRPHRAAMAGAIVSAMHVDVASLPALVVCGDRVGSVFTWDLTNGRNLHSWNVSRSGASECDSGIVSLVSSVQYVVASTSDGFIYVWNKSTDVLHHRIAAAGSVVSHVSLAFMTHRLLVAATADDMRLHMWDASSGDIVHSAGLPPSMEHLNHLHVVSKQTILCSCGSKVLVLNFPQVREKLD